STVFSKVRSELLARLSSGESGHENPTTGAGRKYHRGALELRCCLWCSEGRGSRRGINRAHNPKVVCSNPTPATRQTDPMTDVAGHLDRCPDVLGSDPRLS